MMKRAVMLVLSMLLLGLLIPMAQSMGMGANESISTNKAVYVLGETMTLRIHGLNSTWYEIHVDNGHYAIAYVQTDKEGNNVTKIKVSYANHLGPGTHSIQLVRYGTEDVLAETEIEVREGLSLWPSEYTNTPGVYLGGETMWVKLHGENNKVYEINITDNNGRGVYPRNKTAISIKTDGKGYAIFNITLNMGDGGYDINLCENNTIIQNTNFLVKSVGVEVSIDKGKNGVYLLSEKIQAYVSVYWLKTHTLIRNANYRWWIVDYDNHSLTFGPYMENSTQFTTYTLGSYENGHGVHMVPNHEYILKVAYENTNSTGKYYCENAVKFYTGSLYATVDVQPIIGSLSSESSAKITVSAFAATSSLLSPLSNAKINFVNITIYNHWNTLWHKNYTNYGYTDKSGEAVLVQNIPKVEAGAKISVKAMVSYGNEKYMATYEDWISPFVTVSIHFDKDFYLSGDTANIQLKANAPNGVSVESYDVMIFTNNIVFYHKTTSNSQIDYKIPANYSGVVYLRVTAYFSGGYYKSAYGYFNVYYGYIYMSASKYYYLNPGDKITVYTKFVSNVMNPKSLTYRVIDDSGNVVYSKSESAGEFTFTVPQGHSSKYKVMAEATDGRHVVSNSIDISQFKGYVISTKILTPSKYENSVYEPGDTIEIAYNITKFGEFTPHTLVLHWVILNTNYRWEKSITPKEFSGKISLKIPSELRGGYIIAVYVTDAEGSANIEGFLTINVESGSWSMKSVAGMPTLSLINLILVIVAIVLGVFALLRGTNMKIERKPKLPKRQKKSAPKPYNPEGNEEETEEVTEENPTSEFDEELEL